VDQAAILFCSLFILCIKCLSEITASLIHFTIGGGYGFIRPLPLVEVNQAILAWSLAVVGKVTQRHNGVTNSPLLVLFKTITRYKSSGLTHGKPISVVKKTN
jgi:hypothetical protein